MFKNFRLTKFRNANLNIISSLCATMTSFSYNGCKIPIPYAHHRLSGEARYRGHAKLPRFYFGTREWLSKGPALVHNKDHPRIGYNTRDFNAFMPLQRERESFFLYIWATTSFLFLHEKRFHISRVFPRIRILIKNSGPVNNFLQSNFGRNFRWSTTELAFTSICKKVGHIWYNININIKMPKKLDR